MDLFPDFEDLLAAFAASGVRYVLVGGYAVVFHGRPRATKNLDVFVAVDEANRRNLASALSAFGAAQGIVDAARAMKADDIVYFGAAPVRVDLLGSVSGLDFEAAYRRAIEVQIAGIRARVLALDDLLTNKRASGRPRDLEDCKELERIVRRSRG